VTKLPVVSGEKAIKALSKAGFIVIRQRGSHVRLKKATFERTINVTVPLHDVLDRSTLKSIIRTAELSVDEFVELL
jgi:predicted RNA binding protein YcfA (HicA-like mRNA interferase family)